MESEHHSTIAGRNNDDVIGARSSECRVECNSWYFDIPSSLNADVQPGSGTNSSSTTGTTAIDGDTTCFDKVAAAGGPTSVNAIDLAVISTFDPAQPGRTFK